jgi:hypothetical protein
MTGSTLGVALILTASLVTRLAAQGPAGPQLGISGGLEMHGPWRGSIIGPSAAVSMNVPVAPRIRVQGVLSLSGRIQSGGEDITSCPPSGCQVTTTDPGNALGGTVEVVLSDKPGVVGGYVFGGVGLVRFAGRRLDPAVRGQVTGGLGGALGTGRNQFFFELRLHRVLESDVYPKWLAPIRFGWRTQL